MVCSSSLIQLAAVTLIVISIAHPIIGASLIPPGTETDAVAFRKAFMDAAVGNAIIAALANIAILVLVRR